MKSFLCLPPIFLLHVVLLPLLLQLIQCSILPFKESASLVDQTCKNTPYYNLCISTLQSNPQSSNADVKGLARILVDTLLANATDTLQHIHELIGQTTDQQLERSLAYCAELYIPVVKYNLPQAINALTKGKYEFANDAISDAGKEADACEKKFSGTTDPPLTDRNNLVHSLSDVAVAIVNILLAG